MKTKTVPEHTLEQFPKIPLAYLPTPLEEAPKLAAHFGLKSLYIKRDDLTGLACGGNKARKLEYDFAEIIQGGYDVVLTAGGAQSNHARMTAAACRKLGLDIKLVLGGPDFTVPKGNMLLDALFNAEIRYLLHDDENAHLTEAMEQWAEELRTAGRKPYILPIGGSTALGALGYVQAMQELAGQCNLPDVQVIVGVGSCGTFAGTVLGARLFLPGARVIGISVSRSRSAIIQRTGEIIREAAQLLRVTLPEDNPVIECYDEYFHEYGIITADAESAIHDCANLEGILLDPIYTGKVMAALGALVKQNILDAALPVIFIHTGGIPIVFSFTDELGAMLNCKKI